MENLFGILFPECVKLGCEFLLKCFSRRGKAIPNSFVAEPYAFRNRLCSDAVPDERDISALCNICKLLFGKLRAAVKL